METPESIRAAYAPVANETPDARRRRLASKRAAKYRYFSTVDSDRRAQRKDRQRRWRETLDDAKRLAIREQNRLRQRARRGKMTADDKVKRNQQQRQRRAGMDKRALDDLREREKLRMRRRRDQQHHPIQDDTEAPTERATRLSSSPTMLGMGLFSPTASINTSSALPPAAALIRSDDAGPPLRPPPVPHHHVPIEIAPLQFVLPPASSIQSLTFADRTLAPLPQVQNVLPHASTLLNAAAPPPPPLVPLAIATGPSNVGPSNTLAFNSPFVYAPPSSTSSLGSLLNPSLPPQLSLTTTSSQQSQGVLPSLSQLPELLATSSRDYFFDSSANGYFPSMADFTSEFETTFRT